MLTLSPAFQAIPGTALLPAPALLVAGIAMLDPQSRENCDNVTVYRVEFAVALVFLAFWARKTLEIHRYRADFEFPNRRAVPKAD